MTSLAAAAIAYTEALAELRASKRVLIETVLAQAEHKTIAHMVVDDE